MKKLIFLIFFLPLFSADLNTTLINETNTTIYKNLLKKIESSKSPHQQLQKTLIFKILNIKKEGIKPFDIKKADIKNQEDFVKRFIKIVEKKELAKKYELSINALKEELENIDKKIKNLDPKSLDLLTFQLEYAYYDKKIKKLKKDIEYVNKNFTNWLLGIYPYIDKIEFKEIIDKNIDKRLKDIEKNIKKLTIEKERWEILQKEKYVENIQKELKRLKRLKDTLLLKKIKIELYLFFKYLKSKDEKVFDLAKKIDNLASKLSNQRKFFKEPLNEAINIYIEKRFGKGKTYFYKIKEITLSFLYENTFLNVPLYKFAGGFGIFLFFIFLRKIFTLIILKLLKKITLKTKTTIDDNILQIVTEPLKFSFIILGFYLAILFMGLENLTIQKIIKSLITFTIFWLFYDSVIVLQKSIYSFAKKFGRELYREIGNFFIKTLKIFIFSVGLVAILQEWDINVSAFLASLGLGGLAFALAAKDTASNLFGGLSILADKSLKIDDWIKVNDVEGVVEDIGLRTIKVRTFEKSLVTVPNQIVANNPIENFSRRDIRRVKMRIGLTYDTTKKQIENIIKNIKNMLKSHPGIDQQSTLIVNFDKFEDSNLSIFIYCFTNTSNWQKYLSIKEDINLKIMDIVEKENAQFAFPSQSIYIEKLPKSEEK